MQKIYKYWHLHIKYCVLAFIFYMIKSKVARTLYRAWLRSWSHFWALSPQVTKSWIHRKGDTHFPPDLWFVVEDLWQYQISLFHSSSQDLLSIQIHIVLVCTLYYVRTIDRTEAAPNKSLSRRLTSYNSKIKCQCCRELKKTYQICTPLDGCSSKPTWLL